MLARIKSKFTAGDEGRELYRRAITRLVGTKPQEAAQAFQEYRRQYRQPLEPDAMLTLAGIFLRQGDQDSAAYPQCKGVVPVGEA